MRQLNSLTLKRNRRYQKLDCEQQLLGHMNAKFGR